MIKYCFHLCLLAFSIASTYGTTTLAQENTIVATVDGIEISRNEVHYFLDRTLKNIPELAKRESRNEQVMALGIEHCIKRAVILTHLRRGKFKTSDKAIQFQIEELTAELGKTETTLESRLAEIKLTENEFRREIEWLTSWRKYAQTHVTPEHLKRQFEKNKGQYDGRKIRVGQILWKDPNEKTSEVAQQVKRDIDSGKLMWQDAVKQHSQAASANTGGDLGWIKFSGPMHPAFNEATFHLKVGELSEPFKTPFGIHLVKCLEMEAGKNSFADVSDQVRLVETNRLFELVATKHRKDSTIEKKSPLD